MIPPFNISRVLPPFVGQTPADPASTSPYEASAVEVVGRFATSRERVALLNGLFDYRSALRAIGIVDGFQWINGSFVEEVEVTRQRPPADIDLVTCASRPVADQAAWVALVQSNQRLFDWRQTKATYKCDAYFLDLGKAPNLLVADSVYFFGLFSHQRATSLWKGMLRVPLTSDDDVARGLI